MKYRFDKARIAFTSAYASVSFTMLEISMWLYEPAKTSTLYRYLQQLTYIITAITAFIAVVSLRKLIPKSLKRAVFESLFKAVKKVTKTITRISTKVLRAIGIKPKKRKKRMRDEKSFIFGDKDARIRQKKVKSNLKWRELEDNAERVRFVYLKYIAKIIKDGYKHFPFTTPREVRDGLGLEDYTLDYQLFELYNGARYSGGSVHISDAQLENALKLIGVRKRI